MARLAVCALLLLAWPRNCYSLFGYFSSKPAMVTESVTEKGPSFQLQDYSAAMAIFADAKSVFTTLQARSNDSVCWKNAFSELKADCKGMTHFDKQRLALSLSNCHLEDSGRPTHRCRSSTCVHTCLKRIKDDVAFGVFTQFFMQVEQTCHYLQAGMWQDRTELLITALDSTAQGSLEAQREVHAALTLASCKIETLVAASEESLEAQNTMQASMAAADDRAQSILTTLGSARSDVVQLADNLTSSVDTVIRKQDSAVQVALDLSNKLSEAQNELAHHVQAAKVAHEETMKHSESILSAVSYLHNIMGDITSSWIRLTSLWYMCLAMNMVWVITAISQLNRARPGLYLLLSVEVLLEKLAPALAAQQHMRSVAWILAGMYLAYTLFDNMAHHLYERSLKTSGPESNIVCVAPVLELAPAPAPAVAAATKYMSMTRKQLQTLAKENGIPANSSSKDIISALQALQALQAAEPLIPASRLQQ
eukprot:5265-Heterococcus_DN1.PRE.21